MSIITSPRVPTRRPGEPWTAATLAGEKAWQEWADRPAQMIAEGRVTDL